MNRDELRFAKYVEKTDTCWLWTGATTNGYGSFRAGKVMAGAHRFAWEWAHGEAIPEGMEIHHVCRTPRCVNPAHLEVTTRRRNLQQRRYDSWRELAGPAGGVEAELVTVTLNSEQSAWVRARAAETNSPVQDVVERAVYRYIRGLLKDEARRLSAKSRNV
jgi:hypothetical protein